MRTSPLLDQQHGSAYKKKRYTCGDFVRSCVVIEYNITTLPANSLENFSLERNVGFFGLHY